MTSQKKEIDKISVKFDDLQNHPGLAALNEYIQNYCVNGLKALVAGDKKFTGSEKEIYASQVWDRTSEFEKSLNGLRLAIKFVTDLGTQKNPELEIYRYHYENFVLRIVGSADRAYRLVGAALLIDMKILESLRGNRMVEAEAKKHPEIHAALQGYLQAVFHYKGPRNELIHNSAYSSRELMLFENTKILRIDTGNINIGELASENFSNNAKEMAITFEEITNSAIRLMDALQPIFLDVIDLELTEKKQ